jgi:transposase
MVRILRRAGFVARSSGLIPVTPTDSRPPDRRPPYQLHPCQLRVCFRTFFVFRNKAGDRLKLLYWEEGGYAIWYKRLEVGVFQFPRVGDGRRVEIRAADFAMLLDGVDLDSVKRRKRYQRPATTTP